MTAAARWVGVAVGTALLLLTPFALRALPAAESDVSAARLLTLVRASTDRGCAPTSS